MVTVLNRSDWTTRLPKDAGVDLDDLIDGLPNFAVSQVRGMVVHYTGLGTALSPNKSIPELFRAVQRVDMGAGKSYSDIMYNFGINHFTGDIYPLRGLINKGAANGAQNSDNSKWISCLVTVGTKDDFDIELIAESLRTVRSFILALYPAGTEVCGHRDLKPTGCPGETLYSLVQSGSIQQPPVPEPVPFVCPFPAPTLQVGDTGPQVYEMQNQLAFWGLHFGVIDGIYGNQTAWSVIRAQDGLRLQGLYPYRIDGVYGPKTQEAWCESLRRIKEG